MEEVEIEDYSESFVKKLSGCPINYEATYNAPNPKATPITMAKKPASVVTLRRIHGKTSTVEVTLLKSDKNFANVTKEASKLLNVSVSDVVLVRDGQVLSEENFRNTSSNTVIYVFDRREWQLKEEEEEGEKKIELGQDFCLAFDNLLQKHKVNNSSVIVKMFMSHYQNWL